MKSDLAYIFYLTYLDNRLNEGAISKGSLSLLKISRSSFDSFKYKFENDENFNKKIILLDKAKARDRKIDDIFDDFD